MCAVVSFGIGNDGKGLVAAFKCAWVRWLDREFSWDWDRIVKWGKHTFGFGVSVHVGAQTTWSEYNCQFLGRRLEFDGLLTEERLYHTLYKYGISPFWRDSLVDG